MNHPHPCNRHLTVLPIILPLTASVFPFSIVPDFRKSLKTKTASKKIGGLYDHLVDRKRPESPSTFPDAFRKSLKIKAVSEKTGVLYNHKSPHRRPHSWVDLSRELPQHAIGRGLRRQFGIEAELRMMGVTA